MMNHITILRIFSKGNKTFFDVPKMKQKAYLTSLGYPKDDIDRSYKQYLCQNFFAPRWKVYLLDIISFLSFFPVLLILLLFDLRIKKNRHIDALSIDLKGMEEIIPESLFEEYDIQMNRWSVKGGLRLVDVPYVLHVFLSHLSAGYFSLKAMIKVSQYSQLITMYTPRCIIAHSEYSFSSSILTNYCHKRGVKHVNVQHGEKLFNIIDSFFRFDKFYIWHDHYKQLFIEMGADSHQFIIFKAKSLNIDCEKYCNTKVYADYKYYLGHIDEKSIKSIVESMQFVKNGGKTVKYRYHPRHANLSILHKYLEESELEDPQSVPILESIASCDVVVGSYSTVLSQAYFSGKKIMLDDVTYKEQYNKLKDLNYLLSSVNCPVLSEFQN